MSKLVTAALACAYVLGFVGSMHYLRRLARSEPGGEPVSFFLCVGLSLQWFVYAPLGAAVVGALVCLDKWNSSVHAKKLSKLLDIKLARRLDAWWNGRTYVNPNQGDRK